MTTNFAPIRAQAQLHHAFFLGLLLKVSSQYSPEIMERWMFCLFRKQHEEKFLSSFEKLGLEGLSDAVACAHYHVMSNSIGGVAVEFMPESEVKAWVRFRYPRWMYDGPTLCGLPVEVSRGFLKGWYAQNGVSLNNPRLGFVCVSEDMTGQFGLCGYFKEYTYDLADNERLQFSIGEIPPRFNKSDQPKLPSAAWNEERLAKANRNYAIDYIRNGVSQLSAVIGPDACIALAGKAAFLIGLQYMQKTAETIGAKDGNTREAASYLEAMFAGLGDTVSRSELSENDITLEHFDLTITRGLGDAQAALLLQCWYPLWLGALASFQEMQQAEVNVAKDKILWKISPLRP